MQTTLNHALAYIVLTLLAVAFISAGQNTGAAQDTQSLSEGFYYKTANGWQKLEPITMAGGGLKHAGKMLVPGLTPQYVWTFRGAQSPIQIADKRPLFCVKESPYIAGVAGHTDRDLLVIKFDKKKDHRELQTAETCSLSSLESAQTDCLKLRSKR